MFIIHVYDLENHYHFRKISFEEERDEIFSYVMFLTHDYLCYVYVLFMTLIDIDILCVW